MYAIAPTKSRLSQTCDERVSITWPASPLIIDFSHTYYCNSTSTIRVYNPEMLGKLVHLGFDAVLISAVLAGIKRSTGLTCVSLPSPSSRLVSD